MANFIWWITDTSDLVPNDDWITLKITYDSQNHSDSSEDLDNNPDLVKINWVYRLKKDIRKKIEDITSVDPNIDYSKPSEFWRKFQN